MNATAYPGSSDRGAYPSSAAEAPPPPPWQATFQPPDNRRRIAEWLILGDLAVKLVYAVGSVWAQLIRTHVLPLPFENYWKVYEALGTVMPLIFFGTLLIAGAFFIRWHRLMLRNLQVLGFGSLRHSVEFASWSWFIPIVNWFVPYQSIVEVARNSRPKDGPNTPALVGLWWVCWLSIGLLNRLTWLLVYLVETVEDWVRSSTFELAVLGVDVIAGLLAILVMRSLSQQQVEHHQRLVADSIP